MLVVADPTVRLASFMSKEADVLWGMDPKNAQTLEKQKNVVLTTDKIQGLTMSLVGDSASPDSPFADVKVRQAMSYAIDRQALVDYVLYGYGRPMQQLSVPEAWSYSPTVKGYPHNPEKAKALLKEAGYPNGFSTTLYFSTEGTGKKLFTAVQGYLVDVGINAKLEMLNLGKYGEMYFATGWKDALLASNMLCYPEIGIMTRYFFESHSVLGMPKSIAHPEEVEKVLQEFTVVSDREAQKELAHKAQYLLAEKYCLYTPILMQSGVTASYPWVKNENPRIKSPSSVYTFAEYWIDK